MKACRFFVLVCFAVLIFLPHFASAKDEWLQVRSKNFNLIGDASEKDIRKVATKFEQFRETFRLLFSGANLSSPVPTNVIVFKSNASYKPFKPKRSDGKIDTFVAGYFQAGEDVNYITLSADGTDEDMYGTVFHEYVHFIVNSNFGKSEVPPWFNEGLAEYYQTFVIEEDQKVKLGLPQGGHLNLLQQNKLVPLDTFFKVTNYALHQNANHSRSIFYAQSWALMHYLIANGKNDGLSKFLTLSVKNVPQEKAFQDAFQMDYAQMERELRKYVGQASYKYSLVTFKNKLSFESEMQTSPLSETDTNAYVGDLLYHTNRADDAEPYLQKALNLKPDSSMANTTLGMVKIKQRKYADAKAYLEKAIAQDQKNHLAFYRYAYLLSREGRDEFGYVAEFPKEKTATMREMLKKAIAINPGFTESYEMLAFVSLVSNEGLDEAVTLMQKALQYQPGNQRYAMRMAELYLRQKKFDQAAVLVDKVAKTADEAEIKSRAENLVGQIAQQKEFDARNAESRKKYEEAVAAAAKGGGARPMLIRRTDGKVPTPEELEKAKNEFEIRELNRELAQAGPDQKQILGHLQKIECKGGKITYSIKTDTEAFTLSSKDFQGLTLMSYIVNDKEVGCGSDLSAMLAVLVYKPKTAQKDPSRGDLVSIAFVPAYFRFVDLTAEIDNVAAAGPGEPNETILITDEGPPRPASKDDMAAMQRAAMMNHIKQSLRQPLEGEKREMAFIEKSECSNKGAFFFFRTDAALLKLSNPTPQTLPMKAFTQDIENLQIGCGMTAVEIPVIITYKEIPDKKTKTNGELIALEFVPKSFVLEK
ncbi:MAG: tetratricopeptide repeat protein [Saprospiraceae bacterium]|nr:tetratricopeptide repeat protein [Pyrinomonadaceae bacterium]